MKITKPVHLAIRFGVVVFYLCLGSLVFNVIERSNVDEETNNTFRKLNTPVNSNFVRNISRKYHLNITSAEFTRLFRELEGYIEVNSKTTNGGESHSQVKGKVVLKDFQKWLYFCFITTTTIGYGDVSPQTTAGKVLLIFYAMFGIPLMLSLLALVGDILTRLQKAVIAKWEEKHGAVNVKLAKLIPIMLPLFIFILYMFLGATISHHLEKWDYVTSLYFWFVTFSTIGYGDYISYGRSGDPFRVICWLTYRLIGLAFLAGIIDAIFKWMNNDEISKTNDSNENDDGEVRLKQFSGSNKSSI